MVIRYHWNSYPLLHTIKLVYRNTNNHDLDKHMSTCRDLKISRKTIILSSYNLLLIKFIFKFDQFWWLYASENPSCVFYV